MITDHLITRTGIRSLGLLIAAIVPMASSYFCYMLAYKESPLDTLLTQMPIIIHLFQANASLLNQDLLGILAPLQVHHPVLPGESLVSVSLSSSDFPAASAAEAASTVISAAATAVVEGTASMTESSIKGLPPKMISPIVSKLITVLHYLDSYGYRNPQNIPGYQYLLALQPLKQYLDPILAFASSHQTLTAILTALHIWMAAELVFYIFFWKKLQGLQEVDRVVKGVGSKSKRRELFQRCLETVEEGDGVRRWIEFWFDTGRKQRARFEDIGRLNMIYWLAWAFWAAPLDEVSESPAALHELEWMVDTIEHTKKVKFADGFNHNIDCIRLSLDPVLASHRPLIYYILLWVVNTATGLVFGAFGFKRYRTTVDQTRTASKPNADFKDIRCPPDLAYWHRRPSNPENEVPLVFIQGIGIGLVQYIHLVIALARISRPLILIEVPYVSNSLFHTDCMTPDETVLAIERILTRHQYPKATFMGHSLGTMLCAAMCRAHSASSSKSMVAGLVLVDPICFLTHHSIAHNFAYRTPTTASELVMDLFAAREIGTSWYIMRRFCWNQCVMFPIAWANRHQKPLLVQGKLSPVLPERTRIFLSRNDNLLDMNKVSQYLTAQVGLKQGLTEGELVVMEGLDHAQLLLRPDWFSRIVQAAREC
ncbi:hypothetical protein EDD11_001379 [Mortierella claussenii]|nr:hypothetical protein EDD11_001379 [Mortierella claussenii]